MCNILNWQQKLLAAHQNNSLAYVCIFAQLEMHTVNQNTASKIALYTIWNLVTQF